jgi:hypothetical protein
VADPNPDTWIAISNPAELGFFSWLAKKISKMGLELIAIGAVMIVVPLGLDFYDKRRKRDQA